MIYLTVKEIAEKWKLTERCIQNYCINEKIAGAKQIGKQWLIPSNAEKPLDRRHKINRDIEKTVQYKFPIFIYSTYYNSGKDLNDDELLLLKAQKLHLEGEYSKSIAICRDLLAKFISPYLVIGVHCTIGFASLMLGLQSEYKNSISIMNRILSEEQSYFEDYKFIIASLKYHAECNSETIFDINPLKLSNDALIYYKIILSLTAALTGSQMNKINMKIFNADCNYIIREGVTPAVFGYHCFLGVVSNINNNTAESEYHIKSAIKICIDNNWISHLAKYYNYAPSLFEKHLLPYGHNYIKKLKEQNSANVKNWKIMHSIESGDCNCQLFSENQTELLMLISYGYSGEEAAKIKGISKTKIKTEIKELCSIAKVNSIKELAKYGKKMFDVVSSK